jgi:peptidoglycan/xylan/chitin deacetylase (PgdA/CDA1 family)
VFVVSDYCGKVNDWPGQPRGVPRQSLLSWAQIREMDRHGIEFGAHTVTHPRLDRLPSDSMEREIMNSKHAIEDRLGHPIDLFAYPYGRWSPVSKTVVRRAFAGACTTHLAVVGPRSDPLALPRVDAAYVTRRSMFAHLPDPWFSCYLDVRRAMRTASAHLLRRPWR